MIHVSVWTKPLEDDSPSTAARVQDVSLHDTTPPEAEHETLMKPYGSTYLLRFGTTGPDPGAYINSLLSPYLRRYLDP